MEDWRKALKEIARVLKSGGEFFFEEPFRPFLRNFLVRTLTDHPRRRDQRRPCPRTGTCGHCYGNRHRCGNGEPSVTLVKGDLKGIVRARRLSRVTMRNIKQKIFCAFIYNSLGVPITAGVLYPFFGNLLSPIFAAAAMSFSSVSVIWNALRLRRIKV